MLDFVSAVPQIRGCSIPDSCSVRFAATLKGADAQNLQTSLEAIALLTRYDQTHPVLCANSPKLPEEKLKHCIGNSVDIQT